MHKLQPIIAIKVTKTSETEENSEVKKGHERIAYQSYNKREAKQHTQVTLEGKATWSFLRSFSVEETHQYTHGLHMYPAKMVPQIARELIKRFSKPYDVVLDPFCGSGGVLVESLISKRNSIGVDINDLALLLARVKTTYITKSRIHKALSSIVGSAKEKSKEGLDPNQKIYPKKIPNVYHWFKPYVADDLQILKNEIQRIKETELREFFLICFSATMYNVSNIRKNDNPYFIRIFHKEELIKHKPNVFEQFAKVVRKNALALKSLSKTSEGTVWSKILKASAKELVSTVGKEKVNLIVTSPPYGEERNTMDYSRFSKLSLYWLDFGEQHVKTMRKLALGANLKERKGDDLQSRTLVKKLSEVEVKSKRRAEEVYSFFYDFQICLEQMFNILKQDSYCCIVIGDRTASRISIPNGKITSELCESIGYVPVELLERKMYLRTLRSSTIGSENVLIMKRM